MGNDQLGKEHHSVAEIDEQLAVAKEAVDHVFELGREADLCPMCFTIRTMAVLAKLMADDSAGMSVENMCDFAAEVANNELEILQDTSVH